MSTHGTKWILRWFVLAGATALIGCDSPAPVASGTPTPTPNANAATGNAVQDILAADAVALAGYPDHPQSEEACSRLAAALAREKPEVRSKVLLQFAQQPLGIKLLQVELEGLPSDEEAAALLERVKTEARQTPLRAAALKFELDRLRQKDEAAFLARCAACIDAADATEAERAVALYVRAGYHRDGGRKRSAAADAIRFCADAPDRVQRMDAQPAMAAIVRAAGYLLEADMIESAEDLGAVAGCIHRQMNPLWSVAEGKGDAPAGTDPALAAYVLHAPDRSAVEEAAPTTDVTPSFAALSSVSRLQRLALSAGDIDSALRLSRTIVDGYEALLKDQPPQGDELTLCAAQVAANADCLKRNLMDPRLVPNGSGRTNRSFASASTDHTLVSLSSLSCRLRSISAGTGEGAERTVAKAVLDHVAVLKMVNDSKGMIEAYRQFVEQYPKATDAPVFLVNAAECYQTMKAPRNAADTFGELVERYPDSSLCEPALMKRLLCLYEAEDYEECFQEAEAFGAERPDSPEAPVAQLLKGLSLAALDMQEDAAACMEDLVRRFPTSSVAPRALMWSASQALADTDYAAARDLFQDLIERFPQTEEAKKASSYLERLKAIEQPGQS